MVGGAAGDDDDLLGLAQDGRVQAQFRAEGEGAEGRVEAAEEGVGDGLGLLGDLLEHEGVVAVLLGGGGVPVDAVGAGVGR